MIATTQHGSLRITAPEDVLARLDEFGRLRDGWDSYRAKPPTRSAVRKATQIVGDFFGAMGATRIEVSPALDGGIIMSLERETRALEIRVDNAGEVFVTSGTDDEASIASPAALKACVLWLAGMQ